MHSGKDQPLQTSEFLSTSQTGVGKSSCNHTPKGRISTWWGFCQEVPLTSYCLLIFRRQWHQQEGRPEGSYRATLRDKCYLSKPTLLRTALPSSRSPEAAVTQTGTLWFPWSHSNQPGDPWEPLRKLRRPIQGIALPL